MEPVLRVIGGWPVPAAQTEKQAITQDIPDILRQLLTELGEQPAAYKCYGGVGQFSNIARIPWVACCKRDVTQSVESGYFVVLLFREDMTGVWISLNQGFTQYTQVNASRRAAMLQASATAVLLANAVDAPGDFKLGPIELGASGQMGKGYEAAAILSRYYSREKVASPEFRDVLRDDFRVLLRAYETIWRRFGGDLALVAPDNEDGYQANAAELAGIVDGEEVAPPSLLEPVVPPPRLPYRAGGGWKRNPRLAALAYKRSGFLCEVDSAHISFQARSSKENFVEAHHLIPMSLQSDLRHSVDVTENIVALCPNCHRRIHLGQNSDRKKLAAELYIKRRDQLIQRGIDVGIDRLKQIYSTSIED